MSDQIPRIVLTQTTVENISLIYKYYSWYIVLFSFISSFGVAQVIFFAFTLSPVLRDFVPIFLALTFYIHQVLYI